MATAVEVINVVRRYGSVTALDDVSLTVERGEFFSLLGPSGCGKTTLLRIVGGFETPSTGDLRIEGRSVVHEPPYLRRTNMIFQHLALFPHMNVRDNIAFGLDMKRVPAREIRRKVDEMLQLVRLAGLEERQIDQLSGGQRQRVAMARALVNDPEVLLLDEPLGALDLQLRLQMQVELRRLQRQIGSTFIFVTHDQGEALAMSDRIAVMSAGRIRQIGTPREVYEVPTHRFVAEFMGHSNLLAGRVRAAARDGYCTVDCGALPVEGICRAPTAAGTQVTVAIRYEKIEVLPRAVAGAAHGAIVDAQYLGPTVRIEVRLADEQILRCDVPAPAATALGVGQNVALAWPRDAAVVLADETPRTEEVIP